MQRDARRPARCSGRRTTAGAERTSRNDGWTVADRRPLRPRGAHRAQGTRTPDLALAAAASPLLAASPASAHEGAHSYQADLGALDQSGVQGTGMVTLDGNTATVMMEATGLLAGSPHAQHVHIGAQGECPTDADDENGDGFVSVTEGAPCYGAIGSSPTTTGDTGPDSGLAIDRFPTARAAPPATSARSRSPTTSTGFEDGTAVLVLHGVDTNAAAPTTATS
ncbi:hypothetical protein [Blastococcus sp. SYSU DS0533]